MADLPEDWTERQRDLYGRINRFMLLNPETFQHPDCRVKAEHWQTLAHNAAWLAVEMAEDHELVIVDTDTETVLAQSSAGTLQ